MVPSTSLIINLSVELKRKTEKWNKIFSSGHTYLENWNYEIQSYKYLTNFLCLEIFEKCGCCQPPTLHYSLLVSDWAPASLRGWVDCHEKNFQNWAFRSRRLSSLLALAHCSQKHPPGNVDQHEDIVDMLILITSLPTLEVNIELNLPIWPYQGVEDNVPSELKICLLLQKWTSLHSAGFWSRVNMY